MTNKTRIAIPQRGYGMSLGNMIDIISGEAASNMEGNWIEVEERIPHIFTVVGDNMTVKDGDWITESTNLGFSSWDDEVTDLDKGQSDESQCFGMSDCLIWNEVYLTPYEFRVWSIERLIEALNHVAICAWCPGDI